MGVPQWFSEELIDTNIKALGTYIALLYSRFELVGYSWDKEIAKENVRKEIGRLLVGAEGYKAWSGAEAFLERLYTNEFRDNKLREEAAELLDAIEGEHYDKFKSACHRLFEGKRRYIEGLSDEDRESLKKLLRSAKAKFNRITVSGSVSLGVLTASDAYRRLTGENIYSLEEREREAQERRLERLIDTLVSSGILLFERIIPAPFLEEEFIDRLDVPRIPEAGPRAMEVRPEAEVKPPSILPPPAPDFKRWRARDVLEAIVAEALRGLGFEVWVDVERPTKGGRVECDVWAEKAVGGTKLRVYVTCKNLDGKADAGMVREVSGIVKNLLSSPHLCIFVASQFTSEARREAEADGIFTVELGHKVDEPSTREAFEKVWRELSRIFTSIAPPQLQRLASEAERLSNELRRLSDELSRLASGAS